MSPSVIHMRHVRTQHQGTAAIARKVTMETEWFVREKVSKNTVH